MWDCLNLLRPIFLGFKNRMRGSFRNSPLRLLVIASMVLGFWAAIFFPLQKGLLYFRAIGPVGDILNSGLLAFLLLVFFGILLFSNLITALSTFFLSEDLTLLLSRPVSQGSLYLARLAGTILYSSWMVIFLCVPIFAAYGWVYRASASIGFYLALPAAFIPFLIIPAAIGVLITMVLVNIFPARSAKDVLILIPIFFVAGAYFLWRFMKIEMPADLFSPGGLAEHLITWVKVSSRPFLPSHWVSESLTPYLRGTAANPGFFLVILWLAAGAVVLIGGIVSRVIFFAGWTRSQEARKAYLSRSYFFNRLLEIVSFPLPLSTRALAVKDFKVFFRDPLQWSQLILLAVLVVVYVSSFVFLKFQKTPNYFILNLLSFMSIGMAGFVLATISGRFAFTSVSQEGFSFWVIRSSPISLRTFLWNKFWANLVPLLILAEVINLFSGWFLGANLFMMVLSSMTLFFLMFGIVGLSVGVGAIFPRFKMGNAARMAVGLSGTLYMILSLLFIVLVLALEAWPVYMILKPGNLSASFSLLQWSGIILSFCGAAVVIAAATFVPMKLGLRKLEEMDF